MNKILLILLIIFIPLTAYSFELAEVEDEGMTLSCYSLFFWKKDKFRYESQLLVPIDYLSTPGYEWEKDRFGESDISAELDMRAYNKKKYHKKLDNTYSGQARLWAKKQIIKDLQQNGKLDCSKRGGLVVNFSSSTGGGSFVGSKKQFLTLGYTTTGHIINGLACCADDANTAYVMSGRSATHYQNSDQLNLEKFNMKAISLKRIK